LAALQTKRKNSDGNQTGCFIPPSPSILLEFSFWSGENWSTAHMREILLSQLTGSSCIAGKS